MKRTYLNPKIEIWGGIECTYNRVNDKYFDQLKDTGHYEREEDISLFANLGISRMRYPILWEKLQPEQNSVVDWSSIEKKLNQLKELGVDPIAGLVHHGSGPRYSNTLDSTFPESLADFAYKVAEKFPWLEYYTPINEPLTTARFSGLYGIWHPHKKDDKSFIKILINECKGTVMAMQAIRKINPEAKLIQTEDLGKTYSTPMLKYQADFENQRRWLSFDLICGKVTPVHPMWQYLIFAGADKEDLFYFIKHACPPHIIGFNHYLTSERYLDENIENYPVHTHGANFQHQYADVEAVRNGHAERLGLKGLLHEAWNYFKIPLAVTEVHLHCTREEQLRWFNCVWTAANELISEGVAIEAITAWAMLGSYGWNKLLTQEDGEYESGVFDIRSGVPRPTILTQIIKSYAKGQPFNHPVLNNDGWWNTDKRILYPRGAQKILPVKIPARSAPLIITGKTGTLGHAFFRACTIRGITHELLGRDELNIENLDQIEQVIITKRPWAIINTAGFVRVDDAEAEAESCFNANATGPENLAIICRKYNVALLTFSSDLVFNGKKLQPYVESDDVSPLNIYGMSKAKAEQSVLEIDPTSLVIRTSAFFGPWDRYNFATSVLNSLQNRLPFNAVDDVFISPTYVPDLVNSALDLLLDGEHGIWNLANDSELTWADFAREIALRGSYNPKLINPVSLNNMAFKAMRPSYSVLKSERGNLLSPLDNAIERYFSDQEMVLR
ncbi:sugar nucleotide-binding protein [Flavihumibacter sp. R14]|nr:sugar nucleotide-binding protein [Flavihumibacter soli]